MNVEFFGNEDWWDDLSMIIMSEAADFLCNFITLAILSGKYDFAHALK